MGGFGVLSVLGGLGGLGLCPEILGNLDPFSGRCFIFSGCCGKDVDEFRAFAYARSPQSLEKMDFYLPTTPLT